MIAAVHQTVIPSISAQELFARLTSGDETAVLDVRPDADYIAGHILRSVPVGLGQLEARVARLLPRTTVPVVVADDGKGLAARAAEKLRRLGYSDVAILDGGLAAWKAAGRPLITVQHALSKALGEFVERTYDTPKLTPKELHRRLAASEDIIVLDTRPAEEFGYVAIPGSIAAPGAELLYRFDGVVKSPTTTVVVTCAGRTRGIIGAQALLNAGVSNPVYSLENGTSGWEFAGLEPWRGADAYAPPPDAAALAKARERADVVAGRFGVTTLTPAALARFRSEVDERTLYLLDVRTLAEYRAGHLLGAVSAPGGQLVQATDEFIAVNHARIVVVDGEDGVRGTITASWLLQMDVGEVFLYRATPADATETGDVQSAAPPALRHAHHIDADAAAGLLAGGDLTVIDFATILSGFSARRVVPDSWYASRTTLPASVDALPGAGDVVFLSQDGIEAAFAANEIDAGRRRLFVFRGGTDVWQAAGLPLADVSHPHSLDPAGPPNIRPPLPQRKANYASYVAWGDTIVDQIKADGTLSFKGAA